MESIKRQWWLWASLAGFLFFVSYDCRIGAFILPFVIALLCFSFSQIGKGLQKCLFLVVFYSVWATLQMSFLVAKVKSDSWVILLVLVAEIVVLVCPAVLVAILLKKRPPESIVCALLISDFIFSSIPVGNYFFFLGLPASSYLETIQWVKFTGPSFLSLWIVLTGYLIYRAIYYRSRNEWPPLFTFVLLPIVVSLIQNAVTYNSTYSETQKNVALVPIAG